jgi:hypothetical protein
MKAVIPMIIDLQDRKIIWADLGLTTHSTGSSDFSGMMGINLYGNNARNNKNNLSLVCQAIANLDNKTTLYDLFSMHASARGKIVKDKSKADIIFGEYEGTITPLETDTIVSEYL